MSMTDDEKREHLQGIGACMDELSVIADSVCVHVLALESAGMRLPGMRQTMETLNAVALGWNLAHGQVK